MSAGWIILAVLVGFLAGFVALMEFLCHSFRDALERERTERTEDDQRRRTFIANCIQSRKRYR